MNAAEIRPSLDSGSGNIFDARVYPDLFAGPLIREAMERRGISMARDGSYRFTDAHMLRILILCLDRRVSRQELSASVGLGEGTVRNALALLKVMGLVEITCKGTFTTPEGAELLASTGIEPPGFAIPETAEHGPGYILLVRGRGHLLDTSIAYRDAAIKNGAAGCTLGRIDGGRMSFPYLERTGPCSSEIESVASSMGVRDGDAVVACWASSPQAAASAALGSVICLLGSERGLRSPRMPGEYRRCRSSGMRTHRISGLLAHPRPAICSTSLCKGIEFPVRIS